MGKPYYLETEEKLTIRIHAHTRFTSLKLEDWLSERLADAAGKRLLEIGCGDGNYFATYAKALGPGGRILGWDVNEELLKKAAEQGRRTGVPTELRRWDFDEHPFPLPDGAVDFVIAPFSAYYSKDVPAWNGDSLRVLGKGGRLLILGPTRENARELYELNELATGIKSVPETDETSRKLETEFYDDLKKRPGLRLKKTVLEREIVFPTPEDFAKYYFATWLYEKTLERLKAPLEFERVEAAAGKTSLRLNKKVLCLEASKL